MAGESATPSATAIAISQAFADIQAIRLMLTVVFGKIAETKGGKAEAKEFLSSTELQLLSLIEDAMLTNDDFGRNYTNRMKETIRSTFNPINIDV